MFQDFAMELQPGGGCCFPYSGTEHSIYTRKSLDAAVLIYSFDILEKEFLFIFPPNTCGIPEAGKVQQLFMGISWSP